MKKLTVLFQCWVALKWEASVREKVVGFIVTFTWIVVEKQAEVNFKVDIVGKGVCLRENTSSLPKKLIIKNKVLKVLWVRGNVANLLYQVERYANKNNIRYNYALYCANDCDVSFSNWRENICKPNEGGVFYIGGRLLTYSYIRIYNNK